VVTGDRDLFQLVDDARDVRVLYTARGVANIQVMDDAAVKARYGIAPAQYADFATLRGDPSDGLPGVPGIGEKTAASLLVKFGTLEALVDAAAKGDPRVVTTAGKLNAARDYLLKAPDVVRVVRRLDLPDVDTSLPHQPRDADKLIDLDERLGIGNVLARAVKALSLPEAG
jgi:5'-3' exonuclease